MLGIVYSLLYSIFRRADSIPNIVYYCCFTANLEWSTAFQISCILLLCEAVLQHVKNSLHYLLSRTLLQISRYFTAYWEQITEFQEYFTAF